MPTLVTHFTHVNNLANVIQRGLLADATPQARDLLQVEVGNRGIKDTRRDREVLVPPGGRVCDYVPFYFRGLSPMMSAIKHGRVPHYQDGTERLVYLVTTLERLLDTDHTVVLTDRNAAMDLAEFRQFTGDDPLDDGFIAWEIIQAQSHTARPDTTIINVRPSWYF